MKLTEKQKLRKRLKSFCVMMGDELKNLDPDLVARLKEMIDRLESPAKVAIGGLSASQHRGVGEFFLGEQLFSSSEQVSSCPTIEVRYGKKPQTEAIFGGNVKTYPGASLSVALAGKAPDALKLQLPHPIFADIDFTILSAYDGDDNRAGYLVNLIDDTEVIVWCSDARDQWSPQERRLWFTVPDTLKERSVLALTNAEQLTTNEALAALEQKLEFVSGEFHTSTKLNVDQAKAAVRAGKITDAEGFTASGGQALLKHVMALIQMGQADLMIQAKALRAEIDTIPIGAVQAAPTLPLSETMTAPQEASDPAEELPADERAKNLLLDGTKRCQDALSDCKPNDFGPMFEPLSQTLSSLSKLMAEDWSLTRDHELMAKQVDEATELVGLLSYENNEKAAHEAAEILQQIAIDIWQRLPSNSVGDTRNISETEKVSASK